MQGDHASGYAAPPTWPATWLRGFPGSWFPDASGAIHALLCARLVSRRFPRARLSLFATVVAKLDALSLVCVKSLWRVFALVSACVPHLDADAVVTILDDDPVISCAIRAG